MQQTKTYTPKPQDIEQKWKLIDVQGMILGKAAAEIAKLLIGKHKAMYTPNINVGDKVVVINAEKVEVTGRKETDKIYYHHTGFPGGIKSATYKEMMAKKPTELIRLTVLGMLPKNKLRKERIADLFVYKGEEHPYAAQVGK